MDKQYKNPPIKELVCEFRVSERDSWDLTTFGRLYEAFKDNFPNKKSFTNRSIGVSSDKNELIQNVSIEERILFSSEKREKLIGIGKNLFYFSFLPPYPGWRNAKKQLESLLKTFKEIIGDKKYVRLGFRLLNQITVPNIGKINEYLNFSVNWPKELNSVPKEISALSLFEYNKSKCIVRIYNERNKHPSNSFIFDMDYYLINKDGISSNEALKWFDEAHKNTKAIFEASIKDKLREKFEEAKENENNNFTKCISTENDFVNLLSVSEDKVTSLVNNRLSTSIKENKYDFTIIPREAFSRLENETSITKSKKYLSPYEEGTISVFAHIEAIFSELEANEIAIENPEKVRKYLSLHNDLIEVLKEICLYIFENFENVKSQKIDFFQDVVRTDGYLTLTVVESNFSNKYVKSVLNMYQYFSPYLGKSSGWIQIERDYSIKE